MAQITKKGLEKTKELLEDFLAEHTKDWQERKLEIGLDGVFATVAPSSKTKPAKLMLRLNPQVNGARSRRGLSITSMEKLQKYKDLLNYEPLMQIMQVMREVNGDPEDALPDIEKPIEIDIK